MITESKKIRTRSGKMMMFATLADLEDSVEIVVFDEVMASIEELIATDATMLVKGKVEQKEQGKVSLVVSSVEKFDPSDAEIEKAKAQVAKVAATAPTALKRRVHAAQLPATVIDDLRDLFERYPGETEFVLEMHTRTGLRRLKFGQGYRVQARNAGLRAELDGILGASASAAA
jgi:DNA polymerase-3 subunit alpha